MIHRLGIAIFALGTLVAAILAAMGAMMLANGVPDAGGGAAVLFLVAALCVGGGTLTRYVCGWRAT